MEHLSLCRGFVRGTWRGDFFTEDSDRHVREGFGREHLCLYSGSVRGTGGRAPILRTQRHV
jgi:hypothetical protein